MDFSTSYQEMEPKDPMLKKWIKLYYIYSSDDPNLDQRITYFPNYSTTLNVYRYSKVTWDEYSRTHEYDPNKEFLQLLVAKFDRSREIIQKGQFNKLSIVFHPLGINHFLPGNLSEYMDDHFALFDAYGLEFENVLRKIFDANETSAKVNLLDQFFLSQYRDFADYRVKKAVQRIFEEETNLSIQNLATELGVSRKTLLRLFKKHIGSTPVEYRSIVKFRKALTVYQSKTKKPKLSSLAYEADYYDQSDLNLQFKSKTGLTPQQLFSQLSTIKDGLYWKIDDVPKIQS